MYIEGVMVLGDSMFPPPCTDIVAITAFGRCLCIVMIVSATAAAMIAQSREASSCECVEGRY